MQILMWMNELLAWTTCIINPVCFQRVAAEHYKKEIDRYVFDYFFFQANTHNYY